MKNAEDVKNQAEMYEKLILNQIGVFINSKRKERGMTVRDLNKATGVSLGVISDLENQNSLPRIETLIRIAEVLEIPLSILFENMKPINVRKDNHSKIIADDINKFDKISTFMAGLNFTKEEVAEILSYIRFLEFKGNKK